MKKILLTLVLVLALAGSAWATVGSCVTTVVTSSQNANDRIPDAETVIVTLTCTGGTAGDAGQISNTSIPLYGASPSGSLKNTYNLTGYYLYQVDRKPGGTAPTNNYTVTISDASTPAFALDLGLLTGNGSSTVKQSNYIADGTTDFPVVKSALTVAISANSVASSGIILDLVFKAH